MEFGEKVKTLRKKKHLTQRQLAEHLGITLKAVSNYELKNVRPRHRRTYDLMAKVLETDVNFLLTDDDNVFMATVNFGSPNAREAKETVLNTISMFNAKSLSQEDKDALFESIQEAYWTSRIEDKKKKQQ